MLGLLGPPPAAEPRRLLVAIAVVTVNEID